MKKLILYLLVMMVVPVIAQDTTLYKDAHSIVKVIEDDGVTSIFLGDINILDLEETTDGIQVMVHDDDLINLVHEENRVILKLRRAELSEILENNELYGEEEINLAIGEINEQLLAELENSKIDDDEIDIEIEEDEVYLDIAENGILEIHERDDGVKIIIRQKELVDIEENRDTTKIRFGKKGIKIIENDDGTSVEVHDVDEETGKFKEKNKKQKFNGHWAGFEIGLNNYLDADYSMSRTGENEFMDIHTGRSINVNINFMDYGVGLGTDRIGLLTGMGLEFSNYYFDNNNNIVKNPVTGEINELNYNIYDINLTKSKLTTTYLTVPVILEAQIGGAKRSKRLHVSVGAIGALKIGSHTKVVYREHGSKQKDKNRSDFNLSALRYGATARIGYQALNLYANYYLTPLFEKDKGPELYPFNIGLAVHFD